MAKTNKETGEIFSADKVTAKLNEIREATKSIRKFSFINDKLFTTLKTTKKDMLQKELATLTDLINKL